MALTAGIILSGEAMRRIANAFIVLSISEGFSLANGVSSPGIKGLTLTPAKGSSISILIV